MVRTREERRDVLNAKLVTRHIAQHAGPFIGGPGGIDHEAIRSIETAHHINVEHVGKVVDGHRAVFDKVLGAKQAVFFRRKGYEKDVAALHLGVKADLTCEFHEDGSSARVVIRAIVHLAFSIGIARSPFSEADMVVMRPTTIVVGCPKSKNPATL